MLDEGRTTRALLWCQGVVGNGNDENEAKRDSNAGFQLTYIQDATGVLDILKNMYNHEYRLT